MKGEYCKHERNNPMAFQLNNMQYIAENVNAKSFAQILFTWHRWWWASNGWRVEADTCQSLVNLLNWHLPISFKRGWLV